MPVKGGEMNVFLLIAVILMFIAAFARQVSFNGFRLDLFVLAWAFALLSILAEVTV